VDTLPPQSSFLNLLKNRINLRQIPFSERGSRILIFTNENRIIFRLAERWIKRDQILSAYRRREPIIDNWQFLNKDGQPLSFTTTTYPHRIDFHTEIGTFTFVFEDIETVLILLPRGEFGIRFDANADQAISDSRGATLHLMGNIRRNIAFTTNAKIVNNHNVSSGATTQRIELELNTQECDSLLLNITPRLGFNRYIPNCDDVLKTAEQRWHDWFASVPQVLDIYRETYYYAWWIMRNGLISTRFYTTREAMTPSKMYYVGVWQWDAYFHALAYRYVDKRLAQDQIRVVLDHQLSDGMFPDAIHDEGVVTFLKTPVDAAVTKPPLAAWAAWKLYKYDRDVEFLREIYEPLVRWNAWWFEKNDVDGDGLCEYQHPFSSGLDDNPLWDDGMPVTAPDLNTYLVLQQESLACIARTLGKRQEAEEWDQRAGQLAQKMISKMWNKQTGFFDALKNGKIIDTQTPFGLFPLITGRMPEHILERLVKQLTNRRKFWSRYPVCTVAMDDPKFNPERMWRGPTWVNINYLLIDGLRRNGYNEIAKELRTRTLSMVARLDDIYEYYHPKTGENPPNAAPIFGWSAALFIDLAIQATFDSSE